MISVLNVLKCYNIIWQQFLGNCCHAKLLTPPRHIANVPGHKFLWFCKGYA